MNWEIIRIAIDVLTVLMAVVMAVVLYMAYRSYKKVKVTLQPLISLGDVDGGREEEDEDEEDANGES